jgi:quinol monooxygenase YgiN
VEALQVTARFPNIAPDKLSEFKRLVGEAVAIVKGDPGCLQYDWFLSEDETVCVVREAYASSDAVMAHMASIGALIAPLMQLGGGLQIECFGSPSQTLIAAAESLKPIYYSFLQGK